VERKTLTNEQIKNRETILAAEQQKLEVERINMGSRIEKIENEEIIDDSDKSLENEDQVHENMMQKGKEQKKIINERFEQALKDAEDEKQFRNNLVKGVETMTSFLQQTIILEKEFLGAFKLYLAD